MLLIIVIVKGTERKFKKKRKVKTIFKFLYYFLVILYVYFLIFIIFHSQDSYNFMKIEEKTDNKLYFLYNFMICFRT